jgi:hypothetical protein
MLFNFAPTSENIDPDIEEIINQNHKLFNILKDLTVIPLLICWGLIIGASYYVGKGLDQLIVTKNYDLYYKPNDLAWLIPGTIFSIGLVVPAFLSFYKIILQRKFKAFLVFSNLEYGYDVVKPIKPVFIICTAISMFFYVNLYFTHTGIKSGKLEIKTLLGSQEDYEVKLLNKIILYQKMIAPNGNIVEREHYVIFHQSQGAIYNSDNAIAPIDEKLIRYILDTNNLELTRIALNDQFN